MSDDQPSKFHPSPPSRPPEGSIAVVVITGTSARTEIVDRNEFLRRMAGSPVLDRYSADQQYAVLKPAEVRTWKASQRAPRGVI